MRSAFGQICCERKMLVSLWSDRWILVTSTCVTAQPFETLIWLTSVDLDLFTLVGSVIICDKPYMFIRSPANFYNCSKSMWKSPRSNMSLESWKNSTHAALLDNGQYTLQIIIALAAEAAVSVWWHIPQVAESEFCLSCIQWNVGSCSYTW